MGLGHGLFYLAIPFIVFSFIDLIRHKKKSIPLKRAMVSFVASLVLMFIGMALLPSNVDVEPTDTFQKETQQAEVGDEIAKGDDADLVKAPKEDETKLEELENKKPEETKETQLSTDASKNEKDTQKSTETDEVESQASESNKGPVKTDGTLEVHFLDVGQADSALIKAPNGQTMLIDAGNNSDGDFVSSYLKKVGISKIDVIIGTHPHADHIGGLDDVIYNFDIGKIYMPKKSHTTKTFEDVLLAIQSKGLKVSTPEPAQTFSLGDVKFTILGPVKSYSDLNNNSIVLKMTYGNTSFIFTGDAESSSEIDIVNRGYNLSADVLNKRVMRLIQFRFPYSSL